MDMDTFTPEEKNVLREYINTESGRKFLLTIANYEINLSAESYSLKATTERQVQIANKLSGIYWVRTLISDLIQVPKK